MAGVKIYELTPAIAAILERADGGELAAGDWEELERLTGNLDTKVDQYGRRIVNLKSWIAVRKAEIERLGMGIRTAENEIDRFMGLMEVGLRAGGLRSHKSPLFHIWIQRNSPGVNWLGTDIEAVPPQWVRVKKEIDARAVLDHWKETNTVPDGFEVKQTESLRFK